ncbi:hypothetical protein DFH07DRAFT_752816 [Mycena maculata]|uniref:Uncharacterized protein n=1 Tax=Mycena maculata TaxID=230809 RepID=A0AAD7I960_9AGAR|nr:hypothetical protein DFH07DRAFT_752816 [Mycena maculata]
MFSRITAARRLPQLVAVPRRWTSSVKEGSVAQSKGFRRKERAHENEYARRHETQLLQKMRAEVCRVLCSRVCPVLTLGSRLKRRRPS